MIILAIDTCLDACQVAVCDGETPLAALSEPMSRGHQERLAPMAEAVMASAEVRFAAIERIAVTVGPGSFTGLRVGLAFAKGLALATDAPAVGVGVLEAMACSVPAQGFVAAAVDAKRGQIYLQIFIDGRPVMAPDAVERDICVARLAELWTGGPATLIGSGAPLLADFLPGAQILERPAPDPLAIARLGLKGRPPFPPLRPVYLRAPDAKLPQVRPPRRLAAFP